jgi:hypothetical protein
MDLFMSWLTRSLVDWFCSFLQCLEPISLVRSMHVPLMT